MLKRFSGTFQRLVTDSQRIVKQGLSAFVAIHKDSQASRGTPRGSQGLPRTPQGCCEKSSRIPQDCQGFPRIPKESFCFLQDVEAFQCILHASLRIPNRGLQRLPGFSQILQGSSSTLKFFKGSPRIPGVPTDFQRLRKG